MKKLLLIALLFVGCKQTPMTHIEFFSNEHLWEYEHYNYGEGCGRTITKHSLLCPNPIHQDTSKCK